MKNLRSLIILPLLLLVLSCSTHKVVSEEGRSYSTHKDSTYVASADFSAVDKLVKFSASDTLVIQKYTSGGWVDSVRVIHHKVNKASSSSTTHKASNKAQISLQTDSAVQTTHKEFKRENTGLKTASTAISLQLGIIAFIVALLAGCYLVHKVK